MSRLRRNIGIDIDQQIPAADQVELGERRIGQHVLLGKNDGVANLLADLVMVFADPGEEPTPALRRYAADDALGIASLARPFEGGLGGVAGADLTVGNALDCGELV